MPSYIQWNRAIASFVTRDRTAGSPVYLNVSEDNLPEIADDLTGLVGQPMDDFTRAVRSHAVWGGGVRVDALVRGARRQDDGPPPGVAFLAMMVIAAGRMGENAHPNDYFLHLNNLLDTPQQSQQIRRPRGLPPSSELAIWEEWAEWLRNKGYQPTHLLGDGAQKYIRLPKSQMLLRAVDVDALGRIFDQKQWSFNRKFTEYELMSRIQIAYVTEGLPQFTTQIRDILGDENRRVDAIPMFYDVHESWRMGGGSVHRAVSSIVSAKLRRIVGDDDVEYWVASEELDRRSGLRVTPELLDHGWEGTHRDGRTVALRNRDVWVFAQGSEQLPFETVGRTSIGTPLLLLVKRQTYEAMVRTKLPLDWEAETAREVMPGWVERRCEIRVGQWPDRFFYLVPPGRLSITFTQEVSVGGRFEWLKGRLPGVTVSVAESVRPTGTAGSGLSVRVDFEPLSGQEARGEMSRSISVDTEVPLGQLDSGEWLVRAEFSVGEGITEKATRKFRVLNRDELPRGDRDGAVRMMVGGREVCGASIAGVDA